MEEGMYTGDIFKRFVIDTKYKFSLLPRKCHLSGKDLFLKNAYRQASLYAGPGYPEYEYRWYDKNEFVIAKIKGIV